MCSNTGCPNKHGIISEKEFCSITVKTCNTENYYSLGISKMWSTIFSPSQLTEILGNWSRFQLIKIQKTVQMFNSSVNIQDTKKVDLILEISLEVQSFFKCI